MNYLKKIGLSLMCFFGIILISTLLITILNYFSLINKTVVSIFEIVIPIISIIISGYIIGKKSSSKGWIEGFKFSLVLIFILIILNLIFKNDFEFKNILYYLIISFGCILGSVVGINRQKKDK